MIEKVVHPYNLQKAVEQVIFNKGSAGVDGIKTSQLKTLFPQTKPQLLAAIRTGNYQPQAILGVEIPKSNGKTRLLGVPTTTDRVLQQAVSQVIASLFEPEFSNNSFGFRPNKNARQAVGQARDYIHQGLNHIVDIDLKKFLWRSRPLFTAEFGVSKSEMQNHDTPDKKMAPSTNTNQR